MFCFRKIKLSRLVFKFIFLVAIAMLFHIFPQIHTDRIYIDILDPGIIIISGFKR